MKPVYAALLIAGSLTWSLAGQSHISPAWDLRGAFRLSIARAVVVGLNGARYDGEYDNGGVICTTLPVNVQLVAPALPSTSSIRWSDGARELQLRMSGRIHGAAPCINVAQNIDCGLQTILHDATQPIDVRGVCSFWVLQRWPILLRLPNPVSLPERVPVTLTDQTSGSDSSTIMEFGRFENGSWVVASPPKQRSVFLRSFVTGIGGRPLTAGPYEGKGEDDPILVVDADIGAQRGVSVGSASEAAAEFGRVNPLWKSQHVAGLAIRASLFGSGNQVPTGEGFFGTLLPIRIEGVEDTGIGPVGYEMFLTGARAAFASIEGKDRLIVDFVAEKPRLFRPTERAVTPSTGAGPHVVAQLVADLPTIHADGTVTVRIVQFKLQLKGRVGLVEICLDPAGLEDAINNGTFEIADVAPEVELGLPDCLDTGVDRMNALRPCKDFGQLKKGYMSYSTPGKNRILRLDLRKYESTLVGDALLIGIPER
jgi:hypothetical protein